MEQSRQDDEDCKDEICRQNDENMSEVAEAEGAEVTLACGSVADPLSLNEALVKVKTY